MSIREHFGTRKRRCDTLDIWDEEKEQEKNGSPYTTKKACPTENRVFLDDSADFNNAAVCAVSVVISLLVGARALSVFTNGTVAIFVSHRISLDRRRDASGGA